MCVDYIRTMVNTNDIIYIDTASLMHTTQLSRFISNAEPIFREAERRIIIPKAVCLELARHLGSNNQDKYRKALKALALGNALKDMFDVRNNNLQEDEIDNAFADAALLAELITNKADYSQLLITNDSKLEEDAYNLNRQGSCIGRRIMVCYINWSGELWRVDLSEVHDASAEQEPETEEKTQEAAEAPTDEIVTGKPKSETYHPILNFLIPAGTFVAGFITCKYGGSAVQHMKESINERRIRV